MGYLFKSPYSSNPKKTIKSLLIQSKQQFFSNIYFSFQALVILGLCHYENAVFVCVILVTVFVVAYNV